MNEADARLKIAHDREQRDARLRMLMVASAAVDAANETEMGVEVMRLCCEGRFSRLPDGSPVARFIGEFAAAKMMDMAAGDIDEEELVVCERARAMVARGGCGSGGDSGGGSGGGT